MNTREMDSPNPAPDGSCDSRMYHTVTNNGRYCCGNSDGSTKSGICKYTNVATSKETCDTPGFLQTICNNTKSNNTKSNNTNNNSKQVRNFIGVL